MNKRILNLFKGCVHNESFLSDIQDADGDELPDHPVARIYMSNNEKIIWATWYYGWLVAKYGNDWEAHINDNK